MRLYEIKCNEEQWIIKGSRDSGYKIVNKIPKVNFLGTSSGGNLTVGNYHFYVKLTDTDGNETDFVAESGLVSVFIGHNAYASVYTGNKNEK